MVEFNLQEGFKKVFAVYSQVPIFLDIRKNDNAEDVYKKTAGKSRSVQTNVPMFDKISMDFNEIRNGKLIANSLRMPDSTIIHIFKTKRKVITPVAGADYEVQEIISNSVWKMRIYGFIINVEKFSKINDDGVKTGDVFFRNPDYPIEMVQAMAKFFETKESIKIQSALCNYLSIYHINIDSIDFPPMAGFANVQPFEITATQDEPIELVLE